MVICTSPGQLHLHAPDYSLCLIITSLITICLHSPQVLALAKRMLRRKDKESIVDAAYNRYAFHDTGLPRWFREDEMRHMA